MVLCGRPKGCCPELYIEEEKDEVRIEDDYGNIVIMNKEQFSVLKEKIISGEV